jgi:hypothetical protein
MKRKYIVYIVCINVLAYTHMQLLAMEKKTKTQDSISRAREESRQYDAAAGRRMAEMIEEEKSDIESYRHGMIADLTRGLGGLYLPWLKRAKIGALTLVGLNSLALGIISLSMRHGKMDVYTMGNLGFLGAINIIAGGLSLFAVAKITKKIAEETASR